MQIPRSPLLKLDKATVVGYLDSSGSRDPDVLHTLKSNLLSLARFPKLVGISFMAVGALLTALLLTAFLGVPLMALGLWLHRRGARNLAQVEAGFAEYLSPASG